MTRYESGHEACMKRAIELAKIALSKGDIPVGSLIVRNDKILAEGIYPSDAAMSDSSTDSTLRTSWLKGETNGSAVTASWSMPSVCSCMASPTIWSTYFVCWRSRRRGARRKSKRCELGCSNLALACARPHGASAFTWPRAGPGHLCSENRECSC